ncbi:hypothetical protein AMECASPLE_038385 [Ameca splendens]|uniref:Uncharacterized protein n=1 Tax=Ameca splendens TaxID=208324 RepID=A0ABV1AG31_9TELE
MELLHYPLQNRKEWGSELRSSLKKYREGRHKRVAPTPLLVIQEELGDEETEVTEVQNVITEESNFSTGINLTDDEEESEFTGEEKSVSEEQISQVMEIKECEPKEILISKQDAIIVK